MAHPTRSVARAILGGLVLGSLGAALIFVISSWNSSHTVCEFPGTDECNLQEETDDEVARLQAFAGIGFALLSGGLFLALRRR